MRSGSDALTLRDELAENMASRRHRADLEALIRWYFGPEDAPRAIRAAYLRSDLLTLATNYDGQGGVGLFQMRPQEAGLEASERWLLYNPVRAVAAFHRLVTQSGWPDWAPSVPTPFVDETSPGEDC